MRGFRSYLLLTFCAAIVGSGVGFRVGEWWSKKSDKAALTSGEAEVTTNLVQGEECIPKSQVETRYVSKLALEQDYITRVQCERETRPLPSTPPAPLEAGDQQEIAPPRAAGQVSSRFIEEAQGIIFSLKSCEASGKSLTCHLHLTSKERNQKVFVSCESKLFDNENNEFKPKMIYIANSDTNCSYYGGIEKTLIVATAAPAKLIFEGFPDKSKTISYIELRASSSTDFTVEFRGIPVDR